MTVSRVVDPYSLQVVATRLAERHGYDDVPQRALVRRGDEGVDRVRLVLARALRPAFSDAGKTLSSPLRACGGEYT